MSNQYAYQRPSTLATRTLVTDSKPLESPASGSHDAVETTPANKPTLQRQTTDHYAKAVAAAAKNVGTDQASVASVLGAGASGGVTAAGVGGAAAADKVDTQRPGVDRQQSWKQTDLKRGAMEKMLSGSGQNGAAAGQGYSSTA